MSSYISPWVFLPNGQLALDSACRECWRGPHLVTGIRYSGRSLLATATVCTRCGELNLWSQWLRNPPAGYAAYQVRWKLNEMEDEHFRFWLSGTLVIATSPQEAYQQAVARLVGHVPSYLYDYRQCFIETEFFQPSISPFLLEGEDKSDGVQLPVQACRSYGPEQPGRQVKG